MRKSYIRLFIIALVCGLITFLISYASLGGELVSILAQGADPDGFADAMKEAVPFFPFIMSGFVLSIGILVLAVLFAVLIPMGTATLIAASQLVALLFQIGVPKKWKNIVGIIFTIITISLQVLLIPVLVLDIICTFSTPLLILAIVANIVSIVLFIKELNIIRKFKFDDVTDETKAA